MVGEELERKIVRYEESDLAEANKAALAYADAHMTDPRRRIDRRLRERLRSALAPAHVVELSLKVSAFNRQKVSVTLGEHPPVDPHALTTLSFDARGAPVYGETVEAAGTGRST